MTDNPKSHAEKLKKSAAHIAKPLKENDASAEEIAKLKDQVVRLAAENENLRKRHAKEIEDTHKYGNTKFARDLIEVLENLYRAESSINNEAILKDDNLKQIFSGVELTKKALTDVFDKWGIQRIFPIDEPFNHDYHQAITQIPTKEKPEGTVVQVIQAGYVLKDRLLRPALVAVAKAME
jgi:molecular chaperone GrpE